MLIELSLIIILILYVVKVLEWIKGNHLLKSQAKQPEEWLPISVIVPFKDEARNLQLILKSLIAQDYPREKCEFIFINDHSSDAGSEIIQKFEAAHSNIKLLTLTEKSGKKAALKLGVESSSHDTLITTDADCSMSQDWLKTLISFFIDQDLQLLTAPVEFNTKGFCTDLMQTELVALMASTSGSIGAGKAFMCNGANLVFKKDLFLKVNQELNHDDMASGDDVFLLHGTKKLYGKESQIGYAANSKATVFTNTPNDIGGFFNQRIRWAQKSSAYKDLSAIYAGAIVFLSNLAVFLALGFTLFSLLSWKFFMLIFLLKWILDWQLIKSASNWLTKVTLLHSFVLSILYPFYVSGVAFLSLLLRPKWKGRKI